MDGMFDPYLYGRMRAAMPERDPMHAIIAPLEHREFVREAVGLDPRLAVPMAAAIPVATAGTRLGEASRDHPVSTAIRPGGLLLPLILQRLGLYPQANTSPASWDEIFAGYEGLFSGLKDNAKR